MKKITAACVLLAATVLYAEIVWQKDLETAFEKARKEQKVIIVMVEGKHCRWCKKMKYRTLGDERVEKRLAGKELLESVVGYYSVGDFISFIDSVEQKVPLRQPR
ncbi:MAG: hypothetical protein B5M46_03235 [Epsilonproteobacteria bacterium 4484_20]|nr:MAG: hypothetical protein B5M46_03235 [Epsilonproteobacteria bacterium 4484_20]